MPYSSNSDDQLSCVYSNKPLCSPNAAGLRCFIRCLASQNLLKTTNVTLLRSEDLVHQKSYAIEEKTDKARQILNDFDDPIDAIIWHWDFPVTSMAATLCEEFNLPGPSLEAILKCSHKYWSRIIQQKVAPENTPTLGSKDSQGFPLVHLHPPS